MAVEMVLVGCKHPNGLILNLDRYERTDAASLNVMRHRDPRTVTLLGWAHEHNKPDLTQGTGGYRMTPVPADFWEAWLKHNQDSPLLADRIILAPPKSRDAQAQAVEHAAVPKMFPPAREGSVAGVTAMQTDAR